jgi:hypothetical protein
MTVDEKIIEKIQKLLNHADGTENEAEQIAFIEKAQLLMQQYAIDQETVKAYDAKGADVITTITIPIQSSTPLTNGKRDLLNACAQNNRCRMYYVAARHSGSVVGYEADARYVVMLYTHLLGQMEWEMVMAQAELDGYESVRTFKANFVQSFASKIGQRLRKMNENIAPDQSTEEGASMALVLVGRSEAVEKYVDDNLNLKSGQRSRLNYSAHGRSSGSAAGERADIAGARGTTQRIGE